MMIWENNVSLLVMLCPCIGPSGKEESIVYWPEESKSIMDLGEDF